VSGAVGAMWRQLRHDSRIASLQKQQVRGRHVLAGHTTSDDVGHTSPVRVEPLTTTCIRLLAAPHLSACWLYLATSSMG
jgi:hypothetical protein